MSKQTFIIAVLALVALIIFLFVDAPPPLELSTQKGKTIPVETLFKVVADENATARSLYTQEIVGPGIKAGLKFDEKWRSPEVEAGPLPALFLRETALGLEKHSTRLGLFLGSDYPIALSNKFAGKQEEAFKKIRESKQAEFFYADDTKLYTAMFPDIAAAPACVSCHNQHAQSPKKDWQLNDIMGATTWSYSQKEVTYDELINIVSALRLSFRETYEVYLTKTKTYSNPPEIGAKWPRDGYFLPDAETFFQELTKRSSIKTVDTLIKANGSSKDVK
jgi:adenylate cyclase